MNKKIIFSLFFLIFIVNTFSLCIVPTSENSSETISCDLNETIRVEEVTRVEGEAVEDFNVYYKYYDSTDTLVGTGQASYGSVFGKIVIDLNNQYTNKVGRYTVDLNLVHLTDSNYNVPNFPKTFFIEDLNKTPKWGSDLNSSIISEINENQTLLEGIDVNLTQVLFGLDDINSSVLAIGSSSDVNGLYVTVASVQDIVLGDTLSVAISVLDVNREPITPDSISVEIQKPDGGILKSFSKTDLTGLSLGVYSLDYTPTGQLVKGIYPVVVTVNHNGLSSKAVSLTRIYNDGPYGLLLTQFDSVVKRGEVFSFEYYVKNFGFDDSVVEVESWVEQDGIKYGKDVEKFFVDKFGSSGFERSFVRGIDTSELHEGKAFVFVKANYSHDREPEVVFETFDVNGFVVGSGSSEEEFVFSSLFVPLVILNFGDFVLPVSLGFVVLVLVLVFLLFRKKKVLKRRVVHV